MIRAEELVAALRGSNERCNNSRTIFEGIVAGGSKKNGINFNPINKVL